MSKNEIRETLSKNIRKYLQEYDMSQADLARRLNVSGQTITNWVNCLGEPRMDKVDKICEIFHCSRSNLLEENHIDNNDEIIKIYNQLDNEDKTTIKNMMQVLLMNDKYKKDASSSAS